MTLQAAITYRTGGGRLKEFRTRVKIDIDQHLPDA